MTPDKIFRTTTYLDNDKGKVVWKETPVNGAENIAYIRKDIHDDIVKTAEDHAFFAGQEKFRERLIKWVIDMKRMYKGATPIENAYQTMINKLYSM